MTEKKRNYDEGQLQSPTSSKLRITRRKMLAIGAVAVTTTPLLLMWNKHRKQSVYPKYVKIELNPPPLEIIKPSRPTWYTSETQPKAQLQPRKADLQLAPLFNNTILLPLGLTALSWNKKDCELGFDFTFKKDALPGHCVRIDCTAVSKTGKVLEKRWGTFGNPNLSKPQYTSKVISPSKSADLTLALSTKDYTKIKIIVLEINEFIRKS